MESLQKNVAVVVFALYFTVVASSPLTSTTTRAPCDPSLEDQNLPDQSDCANYFRCVYGKLVPKICPEKMLFNPEIGNCDLFYNVDCSARARSPEHEQKPEIADADVRSTTFKKIRDNVSDTSTLSRFVYIPHEEHPNAFYKFENGRKSLMYCEEGMVFSSDLEICVKLYNRVR